MQLESEWEEIDVNKNSYIYLTDIYINPENIITLSYSEKLWYKIPKWFDLFKRIIKEFININNNT